MSTGKIIGYIFAGIFILFGVLFLLAAFNGQPVSQAIPYIIIAAVLIGIGLVIIVAIRLREPKPKQEIIQKIDLTGEAALSKLTCKNCGAQLDQSNVKLVEGAIMVTCPYCGSVYQITEEPKW